MDKQEKWNLIIVVILMTAIFAGWNYFFPSPLPNKVTAQQGITTSLEGQPSHPNETERPRILPASQDSPTAIRVAIESEKIAGSINLRGALFDDLILKKYHETTDDNSAQIRLLTPSTKGPGYYAELGWLSQDSHLSLPNHTTVWHASDTHLRVNQPLILTWDNGQGLVFKRTIMLDEDYMFSITDQVQNTSEHPFALYPYGLIKRQEKPAVQDYFILHEGPLGYLGNSLIELKYPDLQEIGVKSYDSTGGWLGITDKYWLTALVPDQAEKIKASYRYENIGSQNHYQVDWMGGVVNLEKGASYRFKSHFFAGAKILDLLDKYETTIGMKHFDLAVDFGWFYIITKPIFHLLTLLKDYLGNFGLAILVMTILLKICFFPFANKSYRSMARLRTLQPKIQQLKNRYDNDKMRLNQELMELYRKEKVNPLGGCLPMVFQFPVFFALYKVLFVTLEMRHAPFYGWIHDLSAPDPTTLFNLFGLLPWTPPSFLMIGAWPIIMGLTMFLQQKLNPAPADPIQARMFLLLPIVLTFVLGGFPAGLVIYWSWNNILTCLQQWSIMRLAPAPEGKKK